MRIGIIGGSVAGLSLFSALKQHGLTASVDIFERSRGQLVDRGAGLGCRKDVVLTFGSSRFITTKQNSRVAHYENNFDVRETIDADATSYGQLLSFLRNEVPNHSYHSGKEFQQLEENLHDKTVKTYFTDGTVETFDLLIFADGFMSKGRKYVDEGSDDENHDAKYAGYTLLRGCIDTASVPQDLQILCDGSLHLFPSEAAHGVAYLIPEPDRLNWGVYLPCNWSDLQLDADKREFTLTSSELSRRPELLDFFTKIMKGGNFVPLLVRLFEATKEQRLLFVQPIYEYNPTKLVSERSPIALIGDAAHVASPITGAGALNALLDSRALAIALSTSSTISSGLKDYESRRLREVRRLVASGSQWGEGFVERSKVWNRTSSDST